MLRDPPHAKIAGYLAGIASVAAVLAVSVPLAARLDTATVALALVLAVLFVAYLWGSGPAVLASVLGGLAFDYYFLPPLHTLYIANPQDWVALGAFLITAATVGGLAARVKRRAAEAEAGRQSSRSESAYNRALIEASLDPLVTIGPDGRITDANAATEAITGRPRVKIIGTDFSDYFTDPAQARTGYERAFREGSVRDYPLQVRRSDGMETPVLYNASVYRDEHGAVAGVFAAARDVSGITRAEREVRHLASFPRGTPVSIVEFDRNMNVLFISPSMEKTLRELEIDDPSGFVPAPWKAKLEALDGAEEAGTAEIEIAGRTFDERLALSKEFGSLRIWASDITERQEARRALERLNLTLKTLSSANQTLVRAKSEPELLQNMCRVLTDVGGFRMAWIGFAEHDEAKTVRVAAVAGHNEGYVEQAQISWADTERGQGSAGTAIRTGEAQINLEFSDPRMAPWRTEALKRGYASSAALPLRDDAGVFGVLVVYAAQPQAIDPRTLDLFRELASDLAYGIAAIRSNREREVGVRRLRDNLEDTVGAIASTVEARDPYTAGHQRRVALLARAIAKEMGLPDEKIQGLYLAGLIHDVGKINVPAEILSKPGALSPLEMQFVRTHVQAGYDIIKGIEFPWPVAETVLDHHERLDGSGYPRHLAGDQIIVEARILAVADVAETMMSHRPYRPAKGLDAALSEIESGKGRLYDPAVVDACVGLFRDKGFAFQ